MKKITFLILTFFICAVGLAQPANDLCANPIAITGDGAITGTTVGATADTAPTCVTSTGAPGVWYTITDASGVGSSVTLSLCGSGYDTKISVYTGACGALVCVTGNDDFCGLQSQVNFTSDGSSTYRILVHGFGSGTGAFTLTTTGFPVAPPPGGDINECASGLPLPIDPPASVVSTLTVTETGVIGTASGDYHFDDVILNVASGWANDLNFTLVAPSGATLDLSSGNGGSGGLNPAQTLTFTDSSGNAITGWTSGFPLANYQPEGGLLNTVFAGQPVNGTWTLNILDNFAFGDGGSLNSFCLDMSLITVVGNPPTIACPADITINNAVGTCGAVANFAGVAFDVEDGNISSSIVATPASGSTFPVGVTTVELSVTDSDGNTVTCNFTVTVLDNEAPMAVCQDLTVDLDPVTGMATITGAQVDNGSTDNCGITSMTLDVSSFDCSMTGANTVVLTVTDNSGNSSTCTATVTVQDVTAPEIVCVGGVATFTESEDFEGATVPTGWTTVIESGSQDWTFGSGDMPTGGDFPTNAAIFDDDAAGSGAANMARLLSPVYDLTSASNVQLSFDYALQDFAGSGVLYAEVWDGAAWQQVFIIDDVDTNPVNTGDIDVSAYVNAAFQVRYTYDDEDGGWNWGAGVDNFLLSYEASSGGGLDVYLDANGMASVDPNSLVSVNEACGYTVTAGGVGGGTSGSLTTFFIGTNGGSSGWTVMYDVTVGPADIQVTELDINSTSTAAFDLDLYVRTGTYVGNETNAAAWGAVAATGSGTGAGTDLPSNVVLDAPVVLSANTTYGFAVVTTGLGQRYTNGDGTNQNFSNADMSMSLGTAVAGLFTGSVFTPRVWNGTVHYETIASSGLEFTCADLGENIIEVTVTDDSGNVSTCFATVNVIDNTAPVITCGPPTITTSETEDFEGASVPAGWSTDIAAGSHDWTFGSGVMPGGPAFPTNAGIFDDDAAGSGQVNNATLISPVYDISGATSATLSFDYSMQEFAGDGTLTVEVYDGAAWQQILFVDVDTAPTNSGSLDMLAYLNTDFQVRFTYDDEGGWAWGAGVDNFALDYETTPTGSIVEIELGPDGTTTVDPYSLLSNIDEACGISTAAVDVPTVTCADIGGTIMITVFVSDASGNIASCVAEVSVVDRLAPVLTCPADQTVDPGAGNLFYILPDYIATGEATAIDNCTDPVTNTTQVPAPGTPLPDGVYTITMTATDEYGNTSTCDFELTVTTVIGVDENSLDKGLALYPNPADNVVNLVNKTDISLEKMMIYDINGKLVSQTDLRTMQGVKAVDVSSLASGVYMVQIIGDNASTVKRLIKE